MKNIIIFRSNFDKSQDIYNSQLAVPIGYILNQKMSEPVQDPVATEKPESSQVKVIPDDGQKKEEDSRSIFVKMHFDTKREELEAVFEDCGKILRITVNTDAHGKSKGTAYIAFDSAEAVQHAIMLSGTKVRSREIKVSLKRTNIKGMSKAHRGGFGMEGNVFSILQQHMRRGGHAGKR